MHESFDLLFVNQMPNTSLNLGTSASNQKPLTTLTLWGLRKWAMKHPLRVGRRPSVRTAQ